MPRDSWSLSGESVRFVRPSATHQPPKLSRTSRRRSDIDLQMRLPGFLRAADWFGIAAIGFVIDVAFGWHDVRPLTHAFGIVLAATITVNYLHLARSYPTRNVQHIGGQLTKVSIAWIAAFISLVTIGWLTDRSQEFLSLWAGAWFTAVWLFLIVSRYAIRRQLLRWRRDGRLVHNIAVLGTGPAAFALARRLSLQAEDVNVVGVFMDRAVRRGEDSIAGDSDQLASLAVSGKVDEIIFALPWNSPTTLNQAIAKFAACQVEVKIDLGFSALDFPPQELGLSAGIPTLTVQRRPLAGWGGPVKRAEDIVLSALLLVLLSPLLLIIAIIIKIDSPGPVTFRQERHGFNNNRIMIYKFRSMHHDPDPDPGVPQARRNDLRITRFGAILRRSSLDELPQLFNVLWGDMSLVGPRPHAAVHNAKYARLINGYLARHRMKPGITGWAQVNGWRGETETTEKMKGRVACDLFYIANWTLLFDLKVIVMTIPAMIRGTNAY